MYSTEYITNNSGATNRQLGTWARKGWLSSAEPGTGHARQWSERDVRIATYIVSLMNAGFTLQKAHDITMAVVNRDSVSEGVRIRLADGVWIIVRKV